jgi:uncharacterized protein YegP (UPF0339 family)
MFKIKRSKDDQYYWILVAANGETLCQSETYTSKQSALKGIESCKVNAASAEIIDES